MKQRQKSHIHRPGSLKASNKAHKGGRHKSNRELKKVSHGKISKHNLLSVNSQQKRSKIKLLNKLEKKNRNKQLKAVSASLTSLSTTSECPLMVTVVQMTPFASEHILRAMIKHASLSMIAIRQGGLRFKMDQLRRSIDFHFVQPLTNNANLLCCLDLMKVSDANILLFDASSVDIECQKLDRLLSILAAHGLNISSTYPLLMTGCDDLKSKKADEKYLVNQLLHKIGIQQCFSLATEVDLLNLLRRMNDKSNKSLSFGSKRAHGFIERVAVVDNSSLKIWSYVKGPAGLILGDLVHLPGCGDFKISGIIESDDLMEEEASVDDVETMEDDTEDDFDFLDETIVEQKMKLIEEFPDEIDTPQDIPARQRFAKYQLAQGMDNLDPLTNLSELYSQLAYFGNYKHSRNRAMKQVLGGESRFVCLNLKLTESQLNHVDLVSSKLSFFIWFKLLEHEERLTQVNCVIQPIKQIVSKQPLTWMVGWRRYKAAPILSENNSNSTHLYLRQSASSCVASIIAPLTFTPASVLCFYGNQLVATGSILDCSPNRIILRRIVLSGHPFKVHGRNATVRYMFFNPEDVQYYRSARLRTKSGRRGQIIEPIGTHGLMKCSFDGPITNMDCVVMDLFKRQLVKSACS